MCRNFICTWKPTQQHHFWVSISFCDVVEKESISKVCETWWQYNKNEKKSIRSSHELQYEIGSGETADSKVNSVFVGKAP